MYIGPHVKYTLFLSDFNETRISSINFPINSEISNFVKICLVGAELFHADRHDDSNSRFIQFCERA
jgi:hypothetical protein